MSRPPRSMSSTPLSQQHARDSQLLSLQDGFAHIDEDGEVHVGRNPSSVVYRKRKVSAQPLGRSSPMVPDGRYTQLSKDFTFGLANKQNTEHTDSVLHSWQETKVKSQDQNQLKKIAPGLEGSIASLQRKKLREASTSGVVIRGGKHLRTQVTEPSQMKIAGISSSKPRAETRFSNVSNVSAGVTPMRTGSPDRASTSNSVAMTTSSTTNSRYAASATNINVIGSDMGSLVAHDYRYAWVAQKLAEHEEAAQHQQHRRRGESVGRYPSPALFSSKQRASSAGGFRRPSSATPSEQQQRHQREHEEEDYQYYQQQQQQQQQQHSSSSVVFPSNTFSATSSVGRQPSHNNHVTHYPKLVNQRVHESNARIYGENFVHPKEYFTMKQFKNVPSRFSGDSAHAFGKGGVKGETVYFQ